MRSARCLVILAVVVGLAACSSVAPVPIQVGDTCAGCGRPIANLRLAAEIVAPDGAAVKFRTVTCMAKYLAAHDDPRASVFVTDYETGRFIRPQSAVFVKSEITEHTKELDYHAFSNVRAAVAFAKEHNAASTDWPAIRKRLAAERTD